MRYDQLQATGTVTIQEIKFPYLRCNPQWRYPLGYGRPDVLQGPSNAGQAVPAEGAVHCGNLITCAAVVYVYTDTVGQVQNVAVFHAHTGAIPHAELPHQPLYNVHGVPPARIHVVFASSQQATDGNAPRGHIHRAVEDAADGLVAVHQTSGVPLANLMLVTETGPRFGANRAGEVGCMPKLMWRAGSLQQTMLKVAADALTDYARQFRGNRTSIGIFGQVHDLTSGRARITTLTNMLNVAGNDDALLRAMQTFLTGSHSFKDGSLKLAMVRRMHHAFRHQQMAQITPQNAATEGAAILQGIRLGNY
ncbi:MAG: hypothetical protein KC620_21245 [Myxococcales bacterium]|nr:hypothetical protein [Myxococcales bacterium]